MSAKINYVALLPVSHKVVLVLGMDNASGNSNAAASLNQVQLPDSATAALTGALNNPGTSFFFRVRTT